jgi:hypothetical protein
MQRHGSDNGNIFSNNNNNNTPPTPSSETNPQLNPQTFPVAFPSSPFSKQTSAPQKSRPLLPNHSFQVGHASRHYYNEKSRQLLA